MLAINNLSKKIQNTSIINNVSLNIAKNQIIGLAGPSGGGKSTLLKCIQKLTAADTGSININGTCAFMFQDFQLFPHMTVLENLTYAPSLKNDKDAVHYAEQLLSELNILDKKNNYPDELSGGQQQRVALARSMMIKPDLLLCDEPTSGLDITSISEVSKLISKINQIGITIIIASHDLEFLISICDQIFLLKKGVLKLAVSPKEISLSKNMLEQYY